MWLKFVTESNFNLKHHVFPALIKPWQFPNIAMHWYFSKSDDMLLLYVNCLSAGFSLIVYPPFD